MKKTSEYSLIESRPVKLNYIKPAYDKPNPMIGISELSWSFDSNFVATKNDAIPNVLWIWQISCLSLYMVTIQSRPIRTFSWSPKHHLLTLVTENSKVYVISLTEASIVPVLSDGGTTNFGLTKIQWSNDGKSLIIGERSNIFIATPSLNSK